MPVQIIVRRPRPSLVIAESIAPTLEELSAFSNALPPANAFAMRSVLQVGDYKVGETFCPRLCGNPGIRY